MAHHKSAIKRIGQDERRRMRNKHVLSTTKGRIRLVREAVATGNTAEATAYLKEAVSRINRAASKGVIPRTRASRHISRLSRLVQRMG